jgi:ssDNA thymidine ADP-ribosyltransferase, DarT
MDARVTEFQCIMPLENIPSVLEHGILSHERASKLTHHSVALEIVQERRDLKQVPGGLKLHQYANLYFHARNPMMFKLKDRADDLCVLRVSIDVRLEKGVVFSDCNASSDYVRFLEPSQWRVLDYDDIYALDWRHPNDRFAYFRHRSRKCAEILVPHQVEPRFLIGAWVVDDATAKRLAEIGFRLRIDIDPVLFFR